MGQLLPRCHAYADAEMQPGDGKGRPSAAGPPDRSTAAMPPSTGALPEMYWASPRTRVRQKKPAKAGLPEAGRKPLWHAIAATDGEIIGGRKPRVGLGRGAGHYRMLGPVPPRPWCAPLPPEP